MRNALHETGMPFCHFPYHERHLQCLWADPRLRPSVLATTEGEAVRVEHPGDWNREAGPDFLNAVLLIGKEERRISGDLEIHIHSNGWNRHGHTGDPHYANVRFHVVYYQGLEIPGLIQIPLQEILTADACFSFERIDLAVCPYSILEGRYPLCDMHPDERTAWLESAGAERLRRKAERFLLAMQNKSADQLLWEEIMAALGYKHNKETFRRLAMLLPLTRLRSLAGHPEEAYALLLGLSGILPAAADSAWDAQTRSFIRTLWDYWWRQSASLKERAMKKSAWTLGGIRPANHPVRRLMAAAHYAFRITELAEHPEMLVRLPPNFWNTHISWNTECKSTALVGTARANAIILNVLIPWRAAAGSTPPDFDRLPVEPVHSIIRRTAHALFGPDHTPKIYRSALARQGLIQVFYDYVITHRLDELKNIS